MNVIKQSTEITVRIGPVVSVSDGFTPVTTLSISLANEAELLKAGGVATVSLATNTLTAITGADGWYNLTLTASNTDTVGELVIAINDDDLCLPVFARFQVVEEAIYDKFFGPSAALNDLSPFALREAIGLLVPNLDAQLESIATDVTTINSIVDAIFVDTDATIPALIASCVQVDTAYDWTTVNGTLSTTIVTP